MANLSPSQNAKILDVSKLIHLPEHPSNDKRSEPRSAVIHTLEGHDKDVTCIAIGRDDKILVTADRVGSTIIWDFQSGAKIRQWDAHPDRIHAIDISPDGTQLLTASRTGRIWDLTSGDLLTEMLGHGDDIRGIRMSPDGKRILTTGANGSVRVWDTEGVQLCRYDFQGGCNDIRWNHDGSRFAAAHKEGVAVWETKLDSSNVGTIRPNAAWHARQATVFRENQNWFAAVVQRARQLQLVPHSTRAQLEMHVAVKMLKETPPQCFGFVPSVVRDCPSFQIASEGSAPDFTIEWAGAINRHVRDRVIETDIYPLVPIEMEMLDEAIAKYPNDEFLRTKAIAAFRREEFEVAVFVAEQIETKKPLDYELMAMCHLQLDNPASAKRARFLGRRLDRKSSGREFKAIRLEANRMFDLAE